MKVVNGVLEFDASFSLCFVGELIELTGYTFSIGVQPSPAADSRERASSA